MPGNGSLEANLAALPFLPIGVEGAAAGSLTAIRAAYLQSVDDLVGLRQSMRAAGTSAETSCAHFGSSAQSIETRSACARLVVRGTRGRYSELGSLWKQGGSNSR